MGAFSYTKKHIGVDKWAENAERIEHAQDIRHVPWLFGRRMVLFLDFWDKENRENEAK